MKITTKEQHEQLMAELKPLMDDIQKERERVIRVGAALISLILLIAVYAS